MKDVHTTRRSGGMSDPVERARLMGGGLCAKADFYETSRRNLAEAMDRARRANESEEAR